MKLYEINAEILNCIDDETGEIIDGDKLSQLQIARDEKLENIACWIKNLKADKEALTAEKNNFEKRIASTGRLIESLEKTLVNELCGQKFNTAKVTVSFRKSEKVIVEDVYKLPENLLTYHLPTPNKAEIKKLIKSGTVLQGCKLETANNIQIK